jgi:hypothetical protein
MSSPDRIDFVARLADDWLGSAPDWIVALAQACTQTGQRRAAEAIGYSGSLVSAVLRRRYAADLSRVETAVRGAFMAQVVTCPVMGTLPTNECLEHQRRPITAARGNNCYVRLYRACRNGCPHARGDGGNDGQG